MDANGRPARGTRPPNRRALIVEAATRLFAAQGYDRVSVSAVGDAVATGPSALYRHFAGKDELLASVIEDLLSGLSDTIESSEEDALARLAGFALDHRAGGVLWQREAKRLPDRLRAPLRSEMTRLHRLLAARAFTDTPEGRVHATAAFSVVFSPSFHHHELPRPVFEQRLTELARRAGTVPITSAAAASPPRAHGMARTARREQILQRATALFAERTYAMVGMEDIAAATGIAPSSLYNHYESKQEILVEALERGCGYLHVSVDDAFVDASDDRDALGRLISVYADFALRHPDAISVLIADTPSLPEDPRAAIVRSQRDFVTEWSALLLRVDPRLDRTTATVTAQAAIMVINDLSRSGDVRRHPDAPDLVKAIAAAVTGLGRPD